MITIIIFIATLLFGGCGLLFSIPLILFFGVNPGMPVSVPPTAAVAIVVTSAPIDVPTQVIIPTTAPSDTVGGAPFCTLTIRRPPPTSPTRIPSTGQTEGVLIDAHLAYCFSSETPRVGQEWQIYLRAIDLGIPVYRLTLTNNAGDELFIQYNPAIPHTYEIGSDLASVSFISAQTIDRWETIITLAINAPDEIHVTGYANGELHYGYPGPAMWTIVPLEPFTLTISE